MSHEWRNALNQPLLEIFSTWNTDKYLIIKNIKNKDNIERIYSSKLTYGETLRWLHHNLSIKTTSELRENMFIISYDIIKWKTIELIQVSWNVVS